MPQGKRLAELGVENIGYFSFLDIPSLSWSKAKNHTIFQRTRGVPAASAIKSENDEIKRCIYPAFTVAELGVMLGLYLDREPNAPNKSFNDWFETMEVKYGNNLSVCYSPLFIADYVIYLLENNYITAESCNRALFQSYKAEVIAKFPDAYMGKFVPDGYSVIFHPDQDEDFMCVNTSKTEAGAWELAYEEKIKKNKER